MKLINGRSPNWAFMDRFDAPGYDDPAKTYLTRWRVVQTPIGGIYLHRFGAPDPRSTWHDHPWNFVSVLLRGGYHETTPEGFRHVTRWNHKRAEDLHAIVSLDRVPAWTLMFVGRRRRVWGYQDENGWTRFDEHAHNAEFLAAMAARKAAR